MTELIVALLMIVHGEIKEARIQPTMSDCLKGKRIAKRASKSHIKYQCIKSKAELEENIDGSLSIKKVNNRVMVKVSAEIVNGECPTCSEITMLVGLTPELFRCMNCGADLQQHVNGKITYLPVLTSRDDGGIPVVKDWLK